MYNPNSLVLNSPWNCVLDCEGIFAYKFSAPGTYYYSSGPVDEDGQLYMKGTIKVEEPTSSTHKLVVEVAGFEALHDTMSGRIVIGLLFTFILPLQSISLCSKIQTIFHKWKRYFCFL